jgi:hypothetical protein
MARSLQQEDLGMGPSVVEPGAQGLHRADTFDEYRGLRLTPEAPDSYSRADTHGSRRANKSLGGFDWNMLASSGLWPL